MYGKRKIENFFRNRFKGKYWIVQGYENQLPQQPP